MSTRTFNQIIKSEYRPVNIPRIIVVVVLYLFFIFIAQAWILTFLEFYQSYVIHKSKPDILDLLLLSLVLTGVFVIVVWFVHPPLQLFI